MSKPSKLGIKFQIFEEGPDIKFIQLLGKVPIKELRSQYFLAKFLDDPLFDRMTIPRFDKALSEASLMLMQTTLTRNVVDVQMALEKFNDELFSAVDNFLDTWLYATAQSKFSTRQKELDPLAARNDNLAAISFIFEPSSGSVASARRQSSKKTGLSEAGKLAQECLGFREKIGKLKLNEGRLSARQLTIEKFKLVNEYADRFKKLFEINFKAFAEQNKGEDVSEIKKCFDDIFKQISQVNLLLKKYKELGWNMDTIMLLNQRFDAEPQIKEVVAGVELSSAEKIKPQQKTKTDSQQNVAKSTPTPKSKSKPLVEEEIQRPDLEVHHATYTITKEEEAEFTPVISRSKARKQKSENQDLKPVVLESSSAGETDSVQKLKQSPVVALEPKPENLLLKPSSGMGLQLEEKKLSVQPQPQESAATAVYHEYIFVPVMSLFYVVDTHVATNEWAYYPDNNSQTRLQLFANTAESGAPMTHRYIKSNNPDGSYFYQEISEVFGRFPPIYSHDRTGSTIETKPFIIHNPSSSPALSPEQRDFTGALKSSSVDSGKGV